MRLLAQRNMIDDDDDDYDDDDDNGGGCCVGDGDAAVYADADVFFLIYSCSAYKKLQPIATLYYIHTYRPK